MTEPSPGGSQPVGVLCALDAELALLAEALVDPVEEPVAGLAVRRGTLDGRPVVLAASGVGKVNAAISATALVLQHRCRALVLSGVAGGVGAELGIGDLVVATRVVDVDYGRATDEGRIAYRPGTLPLPHIEPDPGYELAPDLERRLRDRLGEAGEPASLGTVVSGDAFVASGRVRDELATRWDALAVEMEGSAVCGVAERFGLPWLVVRALSDRAGETSGVDFSTFVSSAAARSARLVRDLLPVLDPPA